ncbi:MAG TPA: protein kinase, partial [Polyangia bacterium]
MPGPDRLTGQLLAARYRLTRRRGSGAVGLVYEAEDLGHDRKVAVKLLHPSVTGDAAALAAYHRDAQLVGALAHAHLAAFIGVSPPGARGAFVVSELLEGEDLAVYLGRVRRLALRQAVRITRDILAGLAAAHAAGVAHRDLTPQNVFLCRRDQRRDHVKLLDFGVADLFGPGAKAHGAARYLAPEQAEAAAAGDARTDVWAAGVLLYEMLTGAPAFGGKDRAAILARVATQTPTPVRGLRAEVRAELQAVVAKAMAKAPADRFPSARAMRAALALAAQASGDWEDDDEPLPDDPFADVRTVPQELAPTPAPPPPGDPFADGRTVPQELAPAVAPPPPPGDPFTDVRTVPQELTPAAATTPREAEAPAALPITASEDITQELDLDDVEDVVPAARRPAPGGVAPTGPSAPLVLPTAPDGPARPRGSRRGLWIGIAAAAAVAAAVGPGGAL